MRDYDVAVVGGRIAGAATAMLLARAGLRVIMLERGREGSDTVSTHALMRAGVLQLSRWGVLPGVIAAETPAITHTVFHYPGDDAVTVTIRPTPGVPALYAPRRHVLDLLLASAAADAGAEVAFRTPVTGLLRDDGGRVCGVRTTRREGGDIRVRAALTIGADGVGSRVARETGARVLREGTAASSVLYGYVPNETRGGAAGTAGYEWCYGRGAAAGLIPTGDDQACLFVSTTPARMRALRTSGQEAAFRALLSDAAPPLAERLQALPARDAMRGWSGLRGFVRRASGRGWALVGDAGLFRDPISSHGMTDAMRDAEILATQILRARSGECAEQVALELYQTLRDRLSLRMFELADRIAAYDWDDDEIRQVIRGHSSAMSDEMDYLTSLPDAGPAAVAPLGVTLGRG
ncbi:NAD(P)/FAD-dependent oxidoreductase [Microbacterium cremeum]|uniref:NAD(P)/FAD-dependent oxidoreductase n=1 Tax=Microbacterium cremeum TaxID=2782169 RepID=UPI001E3EF42C|nr:NAD(P)/FAD-dependent oxidoreductase [Microbacterium cremeum]